LKNEVKTGHIILDLSVIRLINGCDNKMVATLVDDVLVNPEKSKKKTSVFAAWDFDEKDDDHKSGHVYDV